MGLAKTHGKSFYAAVKKVNFRIEGPTDEGAGVARGASPDNFKPAAPDSPKAKGSKKAAIGSEPAKDSTGPTTAGKHESGPCGLPSKCKNSLHHIILRH